MNDAEMIEFWKANEKPFGLCPEEAQGWLMAFYACNPNCVEVYHWGVGWSLINHHKPASPGDISRGTAYRIPADYQPEKRGRWVECEVHPAGIGYTFFMDVGATEFEEFNLHQAPGMVGFGGVKYDGSGFCRNMEWKGKDDEKPLKPVAVRFWVEE